MKKWTKKFLDGKPKSREPKYKYTVSNGQKAEKKINFPAALWLELSEKWSNCELERAEGMQISTAFAAGMAVGWAEHERSVK